MISVSVTSEIRPAPPASLMRSPKPISSILSTPDWTLVCASSGWLNEKLPALRDRLRESEEAVVAFRAEHNLIDGGRSVSLDQQQMAELNARLVAARADVAEKKAKVDLLQRLESEGRDAQGLPEAMNSPLLASLRNQLGENFPSRGGARRPIGRGQSRSRQDPRRTRRR